MPHTENPYIKQFFPLVTKSICEGMGALSNDDSCYSVSVIEQYAQNIFLRVAEIDNAFKNVSITMEYLRQKTYEDSEYSFSEHHAHHIENFLLRLTSVVDRSYLLAGSTILMKNSDIERIGGNYRVKKELLEHAPVSATILEKMNDAIADLRQPRNKVAHQAGFSSKNLCVLQAIENSEVESMSMKEITDIIPYNKIKEIVSDEAIVKYESVLTTIDGLVTELIDSLSPMYNQILKTKTSIKS